MSFSRIGQTIIWPWVLLGLFAIGGYLALISSIWNFVYTDIFYETAKPVEAVISEFNQGNDKETIWPVMSYEISGKTYKSELGYSSGDMEIGNKMTIYYDPSDPHRIMCKDGTALAFYLPLFMGLGFSLVGTIGLRHYIRKARRHRWLREHGEVLRARVIETRLAIYNEEGNNHPIIITCSYKDSTGTESIFKSDDVWLTPGQVPEGSYVTVYRDPENHDNYLVDAYKSF